MKDRMNEVKDQDQDQGNNPQEQDQENTVPSLLFRLEN